jgi:hypothetical protein
MIEAKSVGLANKVRRSFFISNLTFLELELSANPTNPSQLNEGYPECQQVYHAVDSIADLPLTFPSNFLGLMNVLASTKVSRPNRVPGC